MLLYHLAVLSSTANPNFACQVSGRVDYKLLHQSHIAHLLLKAMSKYMDKALVFQSWLVMHMGQAHEHKRWAEELQGHA